MSLLCKEFRQIIDPVAQLSESGAKTEESSDYCKQTPNCTHLKRIAALHLLYDRKDNLRGESEDILDLAAIDKAFGVDI